MVQLIIRLQINSYYCFTDVTSAIYKSWGESQPYRNSPDLALNGTAL